MLLRRGRPHHVRRGDRPVRRSSRESHCARISRRADEIEKQPLPPGLPSVISIDVSKTDLPVNASSANPIFSTTDLARQTRGSKKSSEKISSAPPMRRRDPVRQATNKWRALYETIELTRYRLAPNGGWRDLIRSDFLLRHLRYEQLHRITINLRSASCLDIAAGYDSADGGRLNSKSVLGFRRMTQLVVPSLISSKERVFAADFHQLRTAHEGSRGF